MELNCEFCCLNNAICKCDPTWFTFDKIIEERCKENIGENVRYSKLKVSTITICFNFNQVINLELLNEKLPKEANIQYLPKSRKSKVKMEAKKNQKKKEKDSFYNSFEIKLPVIDNSKGNMIVSNLSVYIFPNGKFKMVGIRTIRTINYAINELIDIINYVPGTVEDPKSLNAENISIQMICSDFVIKPIKEDTDGWCIRQEQFKNILVNEYQLSATFSSLVNYPGINLKIKSERTGKNITLLIFRSGSIIITGAKNAEDVASSFKFITDVINDHHNELFYYDINEEIKQKKDKKKKEKKLIKINEINESVKIN